MTKINVIGDIHGRSNWKDTTCEDAVNVFVGDYFDPYERMSEDRLVENFLDIVAFKKKHPSTVLLYGNHDLHYLADGYGGQTTRYSRSSAPRFGELFDEFKDLFYGVAYAPDGRHLVSHAGVTKDWLDKYLDRDDFTGIWLPDGSKVPTTKEMETFINGLWYDSVESENHTEKYEFSFLENCDFWDTYGDTPTQSPIWIRPNSLIMHNAYAGTDVIQIVGHTQMVHVVDLTKGIDDGQGNILKAGIVLVDCLGQCSESYNFETTD